MNRAKELLSRLLHPPKWVLMVVPPAAFIVLIVLLAAGHTDCPCVYAVYCMSAYALAIVIAAVCSVIKSVRIAAIRSPFWGRYFTDTAFRGRVGIYRGMAINFFYVVFRFVAGISYASVWFFSMAVYYLVLGGLRTYLIIDDGRCDAAGAYRCYGRTAWLLFLLNIPMGGMIVLMVRTNAGFSYPGHIIYLSALYAFYAMIMAVVNLFKFRKLASPILSAAKVLDLVSAMMSILGLQTAMIARFSREGEAYRRLMNAITGGCVYGVVIVMAVYMLLRSRKTKQEVGHPEPI